MKKVLGLDLGTNSIGWAVIDFDNDNFNGKIIGTGSRIVPMDTELLNNFEQGNSISKTANRRQKRGARRLTDRYQLRRGRLIDTLKILNWLPNNFKVGSILKYRTSLIDELKLFFKSDDISQDWAIYYLRKKALTEKIELEELARILLNFNQRRGFKSNRKANNDEIKQIEDLENNDTNEPRNEKNIEIVKIEAIVALDEKYKGKNIFEIVLSDQRRGTIVRDKAPDWIGQEKELEIRIRRTKSGESISFAIPDKTDWVQKKEALAKHIAGENLFLGEYHLNELLKDRNYRIREKIVERDLLQKEIDAIWKTQQSFHQELNDTSKLQLIADSLYVHNQEKNKEIVSNDLLYVIKNDIIFYHRPLKSQKSSISECRFEKKRFIDKTTQKELLIGYKVTPSSSPIFQEFRIWKTISNLKVEVKSKLVEGRIQSNVDETAIYITPNREKLFELFDGKEKITLKNILEVIGLGKSSNHSLNYPEGTEFKGNETKHTFRKILNRLKYEQTPTLLNNTNSLQQLWHLVYSLEDEKAIAKALIKQFQLPEDIALAMSKLPPFKLQYGAYSSKALSKLLPLMRTGKYWNVEAINPKTIERLEKIIDGEYDPNISIKSREELIHYNSIDTFHSLPEHLATYAVYGVHSENKTGEPCEKVEDINIDIKSSSLKNPIVEQMLYETMQLVKDVWTQYGKPDEIRLEMAREYKKTAPERAKIFKRNNDNKDDRERIKAILRALRIGNPNSLSDIEKLRIAEENAKYSGYDAEKNPLFKKRSEPTTTEIDKYRLWMDQNCRSPYTGKVISLTGLYSNSYEIEHIIPKSRYYDDSMNNKVIVEAWANKEKDNLTAMQYLRKGTQEAGKTLLSVENYISHVQQVFGGAKRNNLLSDEIPKGFITRQLNDTRHITIKIKELLQQVTPNVYTSIGAITDELKQKWGLGAMMKELLKERFERLENKINDAKKEGAEREELISYTIGDNGKRHIQLKGYEKRIDHRHHALDALVIACTTQSHVQYFNTLEAQSQDSTKKNDYVNILKSKKNRDFALPWASFHNDVTQSLAEIVISYKNKVKVTSKAKNKYLKYVITEDGDWKKTKVSQEKSNTENPFIAVHKSLHKETIAGKIIFYEERMVSINDAYRAIEYIKDKNIRNTLSTLYDIHKDDLKALGKQLKKNPLLGIDGQEITKITLREPKAYSKSRVSLDASFDIKKIAKIAEYDSPKRIGLKYTLEDHLAKYDSPKKAFEGEGLEALAVTHGRPISKVTIYEEIGKKFEIRKGQYVEAAKGSNLYFLINENIVTKERKFSSLALRDVIACKALNLPLAEDQIGYKWFTLSPNELVYVPEENEDIYAIDWKNDKQRISKRIYKMVSTTVGECHFIPHLISKPIGETNELGTNNKSERSWDGLMIKKTCIKLKVDRLGNVSPIF